MTQISLRVDEDVKKQAETVCAEIGMSLSTAINIYLVRLGKERRVPFDVSADPSYSTSPYPASSYSVSSLGQRQTELSYSDPFYSDANFEVLRSRARDAKSGHNMASHNLIEV